MKKIFLSLSILVLLSSCRETALNVKKSGLSEQELISGFERVRSNFKDVFENELVYNQDKLKALNDSLIYYVDALIIEFPNSKEFPELLCRAGVSSLNAKNSNKALEYLNYVVDSFPDHQIVPKSMYFIGRTKDVVLGDIEGAKVAYKKLAKKYGTSFWGLHARTSVEIIDNPLKIEQEIIGIDRDSTDEK